MDFVSWQNFVKLLTCILYANGSRLLTVKYLIFAKVNTLIHLENDLRDNPIRGLDDFRIVQKEACT